MRDTSSDRANLLCCCDVCQNSIEIVRAFEDFEHRRVCRECYLRSHAKHQVYKRDVKVAQERLLLFGALIVGAIAMVGAFFQWIAGVARDLLRDHPLW